ncbi:LysR family transcriptional regulator [Parvibium lacunae]|uniref:LysR family transcriptional regulator n=1 Tax=Parvibium lacunae TaxID=1888893 RepID=A0A368L6W4_9BURK|nr:LysR family transcriptional regulator [Parvibium lacunae]RCS59302.1 LysR family transcriptional regulator [Parvibium lacunae]
MHRLNYHHLHYFWAVAENGHLTRTAEQLHISQSALSAQIKQLEAQLGQALFQRQGRNLILTEAGRIAKNYADSIFATGHELLATMSQGHYRERQTLRIGAVSTLSRNLQESFIKPLLGLPELSLVLQAGSLSELLTRLSAHNLDLVLSNRAVQGDSENPWRCQRIARQQVSLVGAKAIYQQTQQANKRKPLAFPQGLADLPLIVPSRASDIRTAFDLLCEQHRLQVEILAEVDDMAMLRLMAREGLAAAVLPSVVVRDELRDGALKAFYRLPNLYEHFYAITVKRHFQHPMLRQLLARSEAEVLDMPT